jgi:hypothetical protein
MPRTPRAENRKRLARVLATGGHVADIQHPKTTRGVLERVLVTRDMLGRADAGHIVLALAVEPWPSDELAAFGADLDELEPEPDEEDDDPAEDEDA